MGGWLSVAVARVSDSTLLTIGENAFLTTDAVNFLEANPGSAIFAYPGDPFCDWTSSHAIDDEGPIPGTVVSGTVLKDLKRQKYSRDAEGNLLYVYTNVQVMDSATTEGVVGSSSTNEAYQTGWICTWAAVPFGLGRGRAVSPIESLNTNAKMKAYLLKKYNA